MSNVVDHINQVTDPHTKRALQAMFAELVAVLDDHKAQFDAHTHNGDGAQAGSYYTSPPRTNVATVTAGTARTFVQTMTVTT